MTYTKLSNSQEIQSTSDVKKRKANMDREEIILVIKSPPRSRIVSVNPKIKDIQQKETNRDLQVQEQETIYNQLTAGQQNPHNQIGKKMNKVFRLIVSPPPHNSKFQIPSP